MSQQSGTPSRWGAELPTAAASKDGAVNAVAEADKCRLALETCSRHGRTACRHLRLPARGLAQQSESNGLGRRAVGGTSRQYSPAALNQLRG
eukprot:8985648-Alexandrium_andersonii.AAC.1